MKNIRFIGLFLIFSTSMLAQEKPDSTKKWTIQFDGFVKTDFWWDSRQVVDSREGIVLLFPKKPELDKNGADLNAAPSFNFSAITSRLRARVSGPMALGAKTSAMIEGDFSGTSNQDVNGFRLRHAIITLQWKKTDVMIGNFWHPMFAPDAIPDVYSLNTGVPFQPFIRNPQLTLTRHFGKFNLIGSVLTQRDYTSDGPAGKVADYMRYASIPNGHLQLQFKSEKYVGGIACDYKIIQPRNVTSKQIKTDEKLGSYVFMTYHKFTAGKWTFKARAIYGQNLTEHLLLGGYAVHQTDTATGKESYTPTNHLFTWGMVTYGKKVKFGLFGGYAKNLGTTETNTGKYYATGSDIDHMFRISPNVTVSAGKFQFTTELEYTAAAYGKADSKGIVANAATTGNLRTLLVVMFLF